MNARGFIPGVQLRQSGSALIGELRKIRIVDVDRHQLEAVFACLFEKGGIGDVHVNVRVEFAHALEIFH